MERAFSPIEAAAEDIFTFGEIKDQRVELEKISDVTCLEVQASIEKMLSNTPSMAMVGKGANEQFYDQVKARLQ
jgi:hypothetical protein